jgi:Ca2+-binding RTX toxin-like protein
MTARTRIALTTVIACLALPAPAFASVIEITASAGTSSNEYLVYRTTKGESNRVQVLIKSRSLVLVDRGTKRIRTQGDAYGRCRATSRQRVVCPSFPLAASLRDGNDRFTVAPGDHGTAPTSTTPLDYIERYEDTGGAVVETVIVDAGRGDDLVLTSKSNDFIRPGPGRDRIEARGGADAVRIEPDGAIDSIDGGGDADAVSFNSTTPLIVDLAAGTGGPSGEPDALKQFERAHGGSGADVLRGTDHTDALYGEGGRDDIDGRAGNDFLAGDSPATFDGDVNTLSGGDGDDFFDTRVELATPGSTAACGAGTDSYAGGVDTRLDPACELAIPRYQFDTRISPIQETLFPLSPANVAPVAKTATTVTFEVGCPSTAERNHSHCGGAINVERAPVPGLGAEQLGSGTIDLQPGARGNVTVTLNAAGQQAVASADPVAVRVNMELAPPAGQQGTPAKVFAGWQADL